MARMIDMSDRRPDHPDMALMSQIVNIMLTTETSDENPLPKDMLSFDVDMGSIAHTSATRSSTIAEGIGMQTGIRELAVIATAWIEGFMIGAKFAEMKREEEEDVGSR